MDIVKYYIDEQSFGNLILTCKEYYSIFIDMKAPVMFVKKLKGDGWLSPCNMEVIKTLKGFEIIQYLLDTIDTSPRPLKPLKFKQLLMLQINRHPRLKHINLMGY